VSKKIAIIGLGYVGLPIAVAFGKKRDVIGFDIDASRIRELRSGVDRTLEVEPAVLKSARIAFTDSPAEMREANFFIVTVPTPVDDANQPDFRPLISASNSVGAVLKRGDIVVYESTVYPGATEEVCVPILEQRSGLKLGPDFKVGYSPERINPGDREHTFEKIQKVVSGSDEEALEAIAQVYSEVVQAGVFRASTIRVAEAAKVIENTQRDLNIALMNELALLFDRLGIDTQDVLSAAGTKWNFLKFKPGLVGGHCIGVDPYYLTHRAEKAGFIPQVILAGRRINDSMGKFVAQKAVKKMIAAGSSVRDARVLVMGLTFKENCPDIRNTKVIDVVRELESFGVKVSVFDPWASSEHARHEYGIELVGKDHGNGYDAVIGAVAHQEFIKAGSAAVIEKTRPNGVVIDVKGMFDGAKIEASGRSYWRL
jgi:UDP-N-acetyl-D-galactosamine dehydrogenase